MNFFKNNFLLIAFLLIGIGALLWVICGLAGVFENTVLSGIGLGMIAIGILILIFGESPNKGSTPIVLLILALAISCNDSDRKSNEQKDTPVDSAKLGGNDNLEDPWLKDAASSRGRKRPKPLTPPKVDTPFTPQQPVDSGDATPQGEWKAVIYIDFDGYKNISEYWNVTDCAPSGIETWKQDSILNRVKYMYSRFNVLVSRNEADYNNANPLTRIRVVITPTSAWKPGVSGITYNGSFSWGDDTPCFVFNDRLVNSVKYISEIVAHEAGHSLTLNHQMEWKHPECTLVSNYRMGSEPMGNSLYSPGLGIFDGGETFCNVVVNNVAILESRLGKRL
jgi:hypothetical protein